MTRKLIFSVILLGVIVSIAFVLRHSYSSIPTFVSDAQDRVESYLSYTYGPQNCSSTREKGDEWQINCNAADGQHSFVYVVHDAKQGPYGFFLTAMNEGARETHDVDLLSYLDIRTNVN